MANIKVSELINISSMELDEKQVANVIGGSGYWSYYYSIDDSHNTQKALNYSDVFQLNLGYYGGNRANVHQSARNSIY